MDITISAPASALEPKRAPPIFSTARCRRRFCRPTRKEDPAQESEECSNEPLQFRVVAAAAIGSGQKSPVDLDFTCFLVVTMEARRPDHPLSFEINGNQSAPGRQGAAKEYLEAFLFTAILVRVLFPNQWIG